MNTRIKQGKDSSIQTLRGLAILLMVAGHVIGSSESRGLNVEEGSWWRFYYSAFADIRMPLFTMLSGYVYALRPSRTGDGLLGLTKGKSRRLLVPLVTVGTLFFALQLIVPGTNSKPDLEDYWKIFIYGIEHLWFVQAVFIIFILIGTLDVFGVLQRRRDLVFLTIISGLLYILVTIQDNWDVFSVSGAIRLLPFFLIGVGLSRFPELIKFKGAEIIVGIAFIIFFALRTLTILIEEFQLPDSLDRTLSVFLGTFAVAGLFMLSQTNTVPLLSWLGGYSFGIYLLHTFASAGVRIATEMAGISNTVIVFILCLASAIILPIAFEVLSRRSWLLSWGILGQKPKVDSR